MILPKYFNIPQRKDYLLSKSKLKNFMHQSKSIGKKSIIDKKNINLINMSYTDHYDLNVTKKRLKDYQILAEACRRANKYKVN